MPWITYQHSDGTSDKVDVPAGTSVMAPRSPTTSRESWASAAAS